ncbi:MAG: ABC transporter permease, partial [Erysipelothrix sp.]|nr:ABC transporter permease [Erysipelothrix sp.]
TGYLSMLTHPFIIASPVIVLSLLMLSFNLIADGLRDAFDPKMKGF